MYIYLFIVVCAENLANRYVVKYSVIGSLIWCEHESWSCLQLHPQSRHSSRSDIVSANDLLSELVVILPACLAVVTGAGAWPVRPEYLNRMLTYRLYHGFRKEEVAPGACSSCRDMGETTLVRQTGVWCSIQGNWPGSLHTLSNSNGTECLYRLRYCCNVRYTRKAD